MENQLIFAHTINTMNSLKITNAQFPELYIGDRDERYKSIKHLWDKWCNPLLQRFPNCAP